jgi:hypothetical protein
MRAHVLFLYSRLYLHSYKHTGVLRPTEGLNHDSQLSRQGTLPKLKTKKIFVSIRMLEIMNRRRGQIHGMSALCVAVPLLYNCLYNCCLVVTVKSFPILQQSGGRLRSVE